MMRILIVAPEHQDIAGIHREADAYVNQTNVDFSVRMASRPITNRTLRDSVASEKYDMWVFLTHLVYDPQISIWDCGLLLDGNEVLNLSDLATLGKAYGPRWIYLNSCASVVLANTIVEETGADVICTIRQEGIKDSLAADIGMLFAKKLAELNGYVRKAYEASKPANNTDYMYIGAYREIPSGTFNENANVIGEILRLLKASAMHNEPGIIAQVRGLRYDLDHHLSDSNRRLEYVEQMALELLRPVGKARANGGLLSFAIVLILFLSFQMILVTSAIFVARSLP